MDRRGLDNRPKGRAMRGSSPIASVRRQRAPSILDAPVSKKHRIADAAEFVKDGSPRALQVARMKPTTLWSEQELDAMENTIPFTITAEINQGSVDFRVSGKDTPITFEELAAACRVQLPRVVLERRTKWLQYTFDLWSHAGQCLYSIPIASIAETEPASPASASLAAPAARKPRRHPAELAPHHPRG